MPISPDEARQARAKDTDPEFQALDARLSKVAENIGSGRNLTCDIRGVPSDVVSRTVNAWIAAGWPHAHVVNDWRDGNYIQLDR